MSPAKNADLLPAVETVMVTTKRVKCDGGDGAMGHPRVFMDMGDDRSVECKYCGKHFVLDQDASAHGH